MNFRQLEMDIASSSSNEGTGPVQLQLQLHTSTIVDLAISPWKFERSNRAFTVFNNSYTVLSILDGFSLSLCIVF